MLQQTQTERVVPKFETFLKHFPDIRSLAKSKTSDVLKLWNGLGYNRRAIYLHRTAQKVVGEFGSQIPQEIEKLITLPGIGGYTAGAIRVFAFDKKAVFIETNIRRVYIHFFFSDKEKINDLELIPFIEQTLPQKNIREWYYALMDYGVFLGKSVPNPNRKSKHYAKQSKFEGSKRQLRGKILKVYLSEGKISANHLLLKDHDKEQIYQVIQELQKEGLVSSDLIGID
jgi:A/G-specific adenine glycosylase